MCGTKFFQYSCDGAGVGAFYCVRGAERAYCAVGNSHGGVGVGVLWNAFVFSHLIQCFSVLALHTGEGVGVDSLSCTVASMHVFAGFVQCFCGDCTYFVVNPFDMA